MANNKYVELIDLNCPNIIIIENPKLLSEVFTTYTEFFGFENDGKNKRENKVLILPAPMFHHKYYTTHFLGQLIDYHNPIIFTQSKEFLEVIATAAYLNKKDVPKIKYIIMDYDVNNKPIYSTLNAEKAYNYIIEQQIDLRDTNVYLNQFGEDIHAM